MRWLLSIFAACLVVSKPPDPSRLIEEYVVNLDLAPEDRWTAIVTKKEDAIRNLLAVVKPILMSQNISLPMIHAVINTIPSEYLREMQGIATASQLTLEEIVMANIFYEITSVGKSPFLDLSRSCTSLVAQRSNGTVYIARNQDYPPPFTLIMIHAIFQRANKTVYQGTTYAGTIGLSTAAVFSPGSGWAVSIDARGFPGQNTPEGEASALAAANRGAAIFPILTRQACEYSSNYTSALAFLSSKEMIATGYFIVAGANSGEGAIVTRNSSGNTTDLLRLFDKVRDEGGGDWYVAQSNTDHWKPEPIYPLTNVTRRGTATKALDAIGPANIDLLGLWDVLDIYPVFNLATIHTDIISVAWGEYKTYKRFGPL